MGRKDWVYGLEADLRGAGATLVRYNGAEQIWKLADRIVQLPSHAGHSSHNSPGVRAKHTARVKRAIRDFYDRNPQARAAHDARLAAAVERRRGMSPKEVDLMLPMHPPNHDEASLFQPPTPALEPLVEGTEAVLLAEPPKTEEEAPVPIIPKVRKCSHPGCTYEGKGLSPHMARVHNKAYEGRLYRCSCGKELTQIGRHRNVCKGTVTLVQGTALSVGPKPGPRARARLRAQQVASDTAVAFNAKVAGDSDAVMGVKTALDVVAKAFAKMEAENRALRQDAELALAKLDRLRNLMSIEDKEERIGRITGSRPR